MSIIGKTLGHYKIGDQPLGRGGMGEVYRAKDLKLGRDVAIKVLPEEFARDADRVARFQREAKLLASLNHPNIAAIYGLEESGGTNFLVLELVEGETLADQLKRGPIPVEESLKLALQIAEALEAAHEKGVIHRDLKPANIKVTPEGKVKVLDFGLAKAFAGDQADLNLSNSPTLTYSPTLSDAATRQGIILGTVAYMSPEQARGKPVDKRTDIWAFGCVLYEMLTGQAAFQGEDVTEILAAVVKGGANLDLLPANLHPRMREVITRCLQKDLKKRYRDVGDVQFELEQVLADPSGVLVQQVTAVKPRRRLQLGLPWVAVITVLGIIVAGVAVWKLKPSEPRQVIRFDYDLPEGQKFSNLQYRMLAVSPDGRQFVYSTTKGLYLRAVDELAAKIIPGTEENPQQPFFSPDGKWVGYFSLADHKLKKIAINGGAPVVLCDANTVLNASWGADDRIVYGDYEKGIMRISANGGISERLIKPTGGLYLVNPQILPDGETALFGIVRDLKNMPLAVQSLKSDEPKVLIEGGNGRYLPTGHLVYAVKNSLFAVPFDLSRLDIKGDPVPLVEAVFRLGGVYTPQYAVSDSGTLVYIQELPALSASAVASVPPSRTLVWVDRQGKEELLEAEPHQYSTARMSPDGTKLALQFPTGQKLDVWIWDLLRKTMTRLTFDRGHNVYPLWTKDGKRIVFTSNRDGELKIYWKFADGTGKDELLGSVPGLSIVSAALSDDGKILLFMGGAAEGNNHIGALSMEGDRKHKMFLTGKYNEVQPRLSPNGRWMAYASDESGQAQIYVRPFPEVDSGGRWQVSTSGGDSPLWSPDGRELYYHSSDAIMAVSVKTDPAFSFETPKALFRGTYCFPPADALGGANAELYPWDISPDGKRFLMIKPPESAAAQQPKINIVLNWFEELKQRVPVK